MPNIRIILTGAVAAIAVVVAVRGAMAQTAASDQVGKPLALLAGLRPPHENKTVIHAKAAHKTIAKIARKSAAKLANAVTAKQAMDAPPPASALPEENVWPTPEQAAPATVAATAPVSEPAPVSDEPALSAIVVNGQTVQVASPHEVNEIDLAADDQSGAAHTSAPGDRADAAPAPVVAAAMRANASPVGSASWLAQILAALGGALAAGSVAWFLIGSGPVRTYG